jgi:peptide/nickel transport system substrate-binding protein
VRPTQHTRFNRRDFLTRAAGLMALAGSAAALLEACASPAPSAPTSSSAAPPATTAPAAQVASTAAQVAPAAVSTPAVAAQTSQNPPGWGTETLDIAISTLGTQNVDPVNTTSTGVSPYADLIGESIMGMDSTETRYDPQGGISAKWDISPDNTVYTFSLKPNAVFQDGTPVTADDVKFSLDRLVGPGVNTSAAITMKPYYDHSEVVDRSTVKVYAKTPTVFFANWLSDQNIIAKVVPQAYYNQVGPDGFQAHPIGAGPYRMTDNSPGSITLEAVPNHFNIGVPRFKTIKFTQSPESGTRLALLRSKGTDIVEASRQDIPDLKQEGFNIFTQPESNGAGLFFHQTWVSGNPLGSADVRKAITRAVDRQSMLDTILGGQGKAWPFRLALPADIMWQDHPAPPDPYPFDPAAGKQQLASAGYADGFDVNIYIYDRGGLDETPLLSEALGPMLSAIGLRPNFIRQDYGTFQTSWQSKKLQDPAISIQTIGNLALDQYTQYWVSDSRLSNVNDPKMDELISKVVGAQNEQAYKDAKWAAFQYGTDQQFAMGLFNVDSPWATSQKIQKWNLGALGPTHWNLTWLTAEDSKRGW